MKFVCISACVYVCMCGGGRRTPHGIKGEACRIYKEERDKWKNNPPPEIWEEGRRGRSIVECRRWERNLSNKSYGSFFPTWPSSYYSSAPYRPQSLHHPFPTSSSPHHIYCSVLFCLAVTIGMVIHTYTYNLSIFKTPFVFPYCDSGRAPRVSRK